MKRLSAKAVENARPMDKEYKLPDGDGLYLRVRPSGAKSWAFLFRNQNDRTQLRMNIGTVEDMSLKEARIKVRELRKIVAKGLDPRSAVAAAKAKNAQAITMQALFDVWIEFLKQTNTVTPKWVKRHEDRWRIHLKKPLGKLLVRDVTRAHLAVALDVMTRQGIKEETRKALTTLNLMLDYALTRHFIDQNPARVLKPKDFSATASRPRDRVLTLIELRQLWQALDEAVVVQKGVASSSILSRVTANAIKLLILTGERRAAVAGMCWSEVSPDTDIWQLPPNRTKNRQGNTIFLSFLARNILNDMRLITGHSPFVFNTGSPTKPKQGHVHPDSLNTALDRLRKRQATALSKLSQFTIHDLRRSAATAWGEYLKVEPHIIERMLNHQPLNKLVATYQRAVYADEQKEAWLAWGRLVESHVAQEPRNVIPIRKVIGQIV